MNAKLFFKSALASLLFVFTLAFANTGGSTLMEGLNFLEQNAKKPGITTTPSGLQYEVLNSAGSDKKPKATDIVRVHYHGTLIDGTVFDSSYARGQDISFGLNQVISGWTEGLQLMGIGDKFRFFIPSDLAYGPRAVGNIIKANSVLIFEVELFGINE